MKLKKIVKIAILLCFALVISSIPTFKLCSSRTRKLVKSQQKVADEIARVTDKYYEKYGVLPSVAVAQAFEESTLGERKSNTHNYHGLASGGLSYSSLEDGVIGYLKCVNNENYFHNVAFIKDYKKQLHRILDGGNYCSPPGNYVNECVWAIKTYGWQKYDRKLFKRLDREKKAKELEKLRSQEFTLKYSTEVNANECLVSKKLADKGTVAIWIEDTLMCIYDVRVADIPDDVIVIQGLREDCKRKVKCEFNTKAKG